MQRITRGGKCLIVASLSASLLAFPMAPAFAAEALPAASATQEASSLSESDLDYVMSSFDELGIPHEQRPTLLAKIEAGEILDADAGIDPVETERDSHPDGTVTVTSRFADGSAVATTEIPLDPPRIDGGGLIGTFAIKNCSKSAVTGWTIFSSCFVEHQAITWSMSFTASYRNSLDQGARITSASGPRTGGIGVGSGKVSILRGTVGRGGTAIAEIRARQNVNIAGIPTSRDIGMRLNVPASRTAYTSHWGS